MAISMFLSMQVPKKTFQEKKVAVVNGKARIYKPPELVEIEQKYISSLSPHVPERPLGGPIALKTVFCFRADEKHKAGTPKATKPDTDNLVKMLKDCMTKCGFWKDDAQVASESITKCYADHEGIYILIKPIGV
ncbi:RusA family crossover junction endodeoxyribonuclease [Dialister hominis]|uniref:Uncharacterized protein n=1 Tax=Dialister hominis TaxID=2582419 RepID=A0A8E3ZJD0_9FIRM|nr:RusA family crossover junction endodeoxyribonuclease [Dialister hominis]BBK24433.1 hypothetical protein Dia5BBH33_03680 [Dialister hominis]